MDADLDCLQSSVGYHFYVVYLVEVSLISTALFLTTWHLVFATTMTQIMARRTKLLDSRRKVPMTGHVYLYVQLLAYQRRLQNVTILIAAACPVVPLSQLASS